MAAPFKRILVPTDFSASSAAALATANDLALCFGADLLILHAVSDIPAMIVPPMVDMAPLVVDLTDYTNGLEKDSTLRLKQLVNNLTSQGLNVRTKTVHGSAWEEILQAAREEKIDLIVISTHGISGFHHLFFGSVAEKVIKAAPCPVLVIRSSKEEK